jgi:CRP-like cAMP-binding protein
LRPERISTNEQPELSSQFSGIALFEGVPDEDITAMLSQGAIVDYASRTWLYRQGESAGAFYVLQSGLVRLAATTSERADVLIRFVTAGEVFGYFAVAVGESNVVSAQVVEPSRLVVWDRETARKLLQTIPLVGANLLTIAVRDILYFHDHTRRLKDATVRERVGWALAEIARTAGVRTASGIEISHKISQRDLADLAGTTVFTVSRELGKLEEQGIVEKSRSRMVVLKPDMLVKK